MKDYRYTGPLSVSTLYVRVDGKRVPTKVRFISGGVVSVPEDHPIVKSLVARGRLTAIEAAPEEAAPEPDTNPEPSAALSRGRTKKALPVVTESSEPSLNEESY